MPRTKEDREQFYQKYFAHYRKDTLEDFKKFHTNNPQVFEEFKRLSYQIKATGRKKYSSKMIINALRWEYDLKSTDGEFKINDKFQSLYGRLLAYQDPEFEYFFEFRMRDGKIVN